MRTVRCRLLVILLVAIGMLGVVATVIWQIALKPALRAGVERTRQEIAGRSADQIHAFLTQRIGELRAAADFGLFWEGQRDEQRQILRQFLKLSPAVTEAAFVDRHGHEVLRVSRSRLYMESELGSLAGQEKFETAVLGETYIGEVYYAPTAEPYVTIAVPIWFTPRETGGALVAEINLKTLWDSIAHIRIGQAGVYVVDRRGRLLAHRDYSKVLLGTVIDHHPRIEDARSRRDPGRAATHLVSGPAGRQLLVASAIVSEPQWFVVVEEPVETALSDVHHVERVALGLMFAALVGSGVVAVWFSGRITRPVRQLAEGAAVIAAGDLAHRLAITTGDEVQRLAEAFNEMATRLETYHQELEHRVEERTVQSEARRRIAEAIAEVGRVLTQTRDRKTVSNSIVTTVRTLLDVEMATLFSFDTASETLVVEATVGKGPKFLAKGSILPRGTGVPGAAVRERRPVTTPNLLSDPRIHLLPEQREEMERVRNRAILALPLLVHGDVVGALSLGAGEGRVFPVEEIQAAQTFADQAALALECARLYESSEKRRHEAESAYDQLSRTQDQLLHAQKMEAVGRLAGGIAHDFNNLLTVIIGRSDVVQQRLGDVNAVRRDIQLIAKTAKRAATLTRQLLAFSRKQVLQPKPVNLSKLVMDLLPMLRRLVGEDIEIVADVAPQLATARLDPGQLEQVVMNLAVNARDAMPQGGCLTLQTADVEVDEAFVTRHPGASAGPHVMLAVTDTGTGMTPEVMAHVFEPFYTTKPPGAGTGLGLSTVYGIVEQHGGYVAMESQPATGTTFRIYIPCLAVAAADGDDEEASAVATAARGDKTILVVDDDRDVREIVREVLESRGYTILEANNATEALHTAQDHRGSIHLLLTDVVMPHGSGRGLAERLTALRPEAKVLYMSGYTDDRLVHHGVLAERLRLLAKPFNPNELNQKVQQALETA